MKVHLLRLGFFITVLLLTTNTQAQIPPGYYDSAQGLSGNQLKAALNNIIKGHIAYPYSSTGTDVWDILKEADKDPDNPDNVRGIYSNFSMNAAAEYDGGNGWTREHVWAQSRGNLGTAPGPGTDCHNLHAEDISTNSAKSNRNFAESETQYIDTDGQYSGVTQCYTGPGYTWEPRPEVKGDVARAIFYMATRYEGDNGEPDLELTETLLSQGDSSPLHGRLSELLLWHVQDPVDAAEVARNDIVFGYQFNRNPFIDHPEYVTAIWGPPPSSLPYFTSGPVTAAGENSLYSYNITTEGGQGPKVLSAPTLPSWLIFTNAGNGNGSISGTPSAINVGSHNVVLEVSDGVDVTVQNFTIDVIAASNGPNVAFINEIHYENESTDQGESIELAGSAGKSLQGWSLHLYNGINGSIYQTVNLSGIFTDQNNGFGFLTFPIPGIQNGAPDGVALVDNLGQVIQFLSYEGAFSAVEGPANGMLSTDIGQWESSATPVGYSLQLTGTGSDYSDFSWVSEAADTFGAVNNGQIFEAPPQPNQNPVVSIANPVHGADFSTLDMINITANASDPDGSVTQVEFFVNSVSIGVDTSSPYGVNWIIPGWGAYVITAVATDNEAATGNSGIVNITATEPNLNPVVSVTNPTDGADFTTLENINITANASDADGSVTQVEFFVNGVSVGVDHNAPYSVNWAIPDWGAYAVTAVATDDDAATAASAAVNITATDISVEIVFINEIHYDNESTDQGEAIELAGNAGTDLSGWSLVLYNGNGGGTYDTANLSGVFTDQNNGYGFISFDIPGIQNGAPDGVALVDDLGQVVQFLSYEGAFTATDGPANGMLSTDIGQSETTSTLVGNSLQLTGTGTVYADFTWADDAPHTFGAVNNGQSFGVSPLNQNPTVSITGPSDGASYPENTNISITASASDADGTITQVEFFANGITIGTDTTQPYSVNWNVPPGVSEITATVTDSDGATGNAQPLTVTGNAVADPVGLHVNSIVTGTDSAGKGKKLGTATVVIIDDLGNPVSGATVNGTFAGSYNEQVSGVTDANGQVELQTLATQQGSVAFDFCVDDVMHATLSYNSLSNVVSCGSTGGGAKAVAEEPGTDNIKTGVTLYPNPFTDDLHIDIRSGFTGEVALEMYDDSGRLVYTGTHYKNETDTSLSPDISRFQTGIYTVKVRMGETVMIRKVIKR